ncbi:MAG: ectoine hydroxylase [Actinomycetota bacterium]
MTLVTASGSEAQPYPTRTVDEPSTVPRREVVVHGTESDGPLDAERLRAYDRRGFLIIDDLLNSEDLERLSTALNRIVNDPALANDERLIREPDGDAVRSVFEVDALDPVFADLAADPRVLDPIRQILGSEVYLHQARANLKPGFHGKEFYWHSDFETWHAEDGMPTMRALSISISLTANEIHNGSLMIIPGSHRTFVGCRGATPSDHYRDSLRSQQVGVPSEMVLTRLVAEGGVEMITGPAGSAVMFDCNAMHGSAGNITPFSRHNLFFVFNSVENSLVEPFAAEHPRPAFIAARAVDPLIRIS